jgi:hypothetical protein
MQADGQHPRMKNAAPGGVEDDQDAGDRRVPGRLFCFVCEVSSDLKIPLPCPILFAYGPSDTPCKRGSLCGGPAGLK